MASVDNHTERYSSYEDISNARLASVRDINLRSSEESLKDAAGRYNGELKQLAEVSACIATRLNAIGQNAHIPPEVLSRIFRFVADLHPCTHDGPLPHERLPLVPWIPVPKTTRTLPKWLAITQVCRRWRDVAFQDPSLWTEVTYATSMTWLRENLARVQSLNWPVTLHRYIPRGYTPFDSNKVELDLIDEHMSHIRELVVLMHPASTVYAVPLIHAAPLLESLTLSQYGLGIDETDDDFVEFLSDDIFAGHVPALRRLAVRGYIFSWTTSPLISASITHFELSLPRCALVQVDVDPDSLQEPSRAQLFLCLQRMPMLEALKLENCWPITSEDPWPDTILEFTHLRRLELTGTMARCVGFLKRVRIPPSVSLNMSLYIDKREISDDYGALIDIVIAQISMLSAGRRVSAAAFQLSAEDASNGYAAALKLWRSQIGEALAKEEWQPFITISFDAGPSVLPVLRLLTSRLHLPELQVLSFFCKFERTHARIEAMGNTMLELFTKFAGVKHLIVNMRAADVLGHAMSITDSYLPSATGPTEDMRASRLFRELTALSLRDTYRHFGSLTAHATLQGFASKYFEEFRRCLAALVQDPGHLQVLNVGWQDLDEWRSLFEGVVSVQPLPAAIERYMDLEATTQLPAPQSVVEIQTPFGLEFDAEE